MRIAAVNQFYWPDLAATSQLLTDLCEHLARAGHEVHVVCSREKYAGSFDALPWAETHAGVQIHRVSALAFHRSSFLFRALGDVGFELAALGRLLALPRIDTVLCLSTPPLVATLGLLARRLRRGAFVYWVQDLYPDVAVALGALKPGSLIEKATRRVSRSLLSRADRIVALGPAMCERLIREGAHPARVEVVHNWSDGENVHPLSRAENPLRRSWGNVDRFCVMYSGNLGLAHDFDTLIGACRRLGHRSDIDLVFVGDGQKKKELEEIVAAERLSSVRFLPLFPRERLAQSLSAADVHLISLHAGLSGMVVPSKVYGVMAAGRPAVYVGPPGSDVWRLLEETGAGVSVSNGNPEGVVEALMKLKADEWLRAKMGDAGRRAFEARFDRRHSIAQMERIVVDLGRST